MDPQGVGQERVDQQLKPEYPPRRNITAFIIIGVVFFILLIVVIIIFFLVRARTNTAQQQGNISTLTPLPVPSFYELVTQDIQSQEVKLAELEKDMRALDEMLVYESVNFSDVLTPPPVQTPEWVAQKMEIAKKRAELEIDRRIATLDKLSPKIVLAKKLSSAQKSQLTNEVEAQISSLSSLRELVSGQTNFGVLIADINILSDFYKNYQVVVPKVYIAIVADKINVLGDAFAGIAGKMTQKTGELRALGKDVVSLQKTLGHMLYVLGDAANKAENALIAVLPLSAQDYPKNKPVLFDAKSKVQVSRRNLSLALSDARNILSTLKAIESGKAPSGNFFQFLPIFRF
jgi:hypothetical protein